MRIAELKRYYDRIVCIDFEYHTGDTGADAPVPICMVAIELLTGDTIRSWCWNRKIECPFEIGSRTLFVAYYAAAEINCFRGLGWPIPTRILDLQVEFRQLNNGRNRARSEAEKQALKKHERHSLLNCMFAFNLESQAVAASVKEDTRGLCIRGGPFTSREQDQIVGYCEADVRALVHLLPAMLPFIELAPALFRGRYMAAVGAVERNGIPIDKPVADRLLENWPAVVERLIAKNRNDLDVIGNRDVEQGKFNKWLLANGINQWPRTAHGRLDTSRETISDWSKCHPKIMELKEFLGAVRSTRLFEDLQIGSDGRNRLLLSPFGSKTGRNTPSSSRGVFGPACWVRRLIQPSPGCVLLYVDWSGQEYGAAAYFSGDELMINDYANDDPYLSFGKRIGLVPQYATKQSHESVRAQLKVATGLGVLYGAQAGTVARAGNMTESRAKDVLREHKYTYPRFWRWRESVINTANLRGKLRTPLGWEWIVPDDARTSSISNFMLQASGADMMRVAVCLAVERGVEVCAPVHDALLVQCPIELLDETRDTVVACMAKASSVVLGGPSLKVGVDNPVIYPDHFVDKRGEKMWTQITSIVQRMDQG